MCLAVRVRNTYSDHPGTLVADIASYRPSAVATAVSHTADVVRFPKAEAAEATTKRPGLLEELAGRVGLSLDRVWTDSADDFAVVRLV